MRAPFPPTLMFFLSCLPDGGELVENGVSYLYPEQVRRMLSQAPRELSAHDDEPGWSRREKLLIVLLLFAIVIVVVLFLVVFLLVSGVMENGNKTEVNNTVPLIPTFRPVFSGLVWLNFNRWCD